MTTSARKVKSSSLQVEYKLTQKTHHLLLYLLYLSRVCRCFKDKKLRKCTSDNEAHYVHLQNCSTAICIIKGKV